MSSRKKILWLVSWYPNKNDRFDGDFIQRHARAAAIYHDIHVIFVTGADLDHGLEEEWNYATGLTEQIIYFKHTSGFLKRTRRQLVWKSLMRGAVKRYIQQQGQPDIVHVHIPWKSGMIALWLKEKWNIPYIVTEHWGIYNRLVPDQFYKRAVFTRETLKKIYREANLTVTVSQFLAKGIQEATGRSIDRVIPNVVDTTLFHRQEEKYSRFTFLHVSNMAPVKNADLILEAFGLFLKQKGDADAQLIMIGNRNEELLNLADKLDLLNTSVFFKGEISYAEVAEEMRRSHCLVMFSDSETFSCVTAEALCCGLPVIASEVGALPELVNGENGALVKPGDRNALAKEMSEVISHYARFNFLTLSRTAAGSYSYSAVAQHFDSLYTNSATPPDHLFRYSPA